MQCTIKTVLVAFTLALGALRGTLNVRNYCDFPVYCMGTRSNDVGDATEIYEVAEGESWTSLSESFDVSPSPCRNFSLINTHNLNTRRVP